MNTLYPTTEANYCNKNTSTEGATLLDGFAMAALQGLLAIEQVSPAAPSFDSDETARRAYRLARAMMRARNA